MGAAHDRLSERAFPWKVLSIITAVVKSMEKAVVHELKTSKMYMVRSERVSGIFDDLSWARAQ